jgi:prepilin-type processing-associated H-X9-DG protein
MYAIGDSLALEAWPNKIHGGDYSYFFGRMLTQANPKIGYAATTNFQHGWRNNILFVDGHVQTVRIADVFGKGSDSLRHWNKDDQP